jgi:hypothetical protein
MNATERPPEPACKWCEAAEWRWNGFEWYPAGAGTRKLHVCMTPEALADRADRERRAAHGGIRRAFSKLVR